MVYFQVGYRTRIAEIERATQAVCLIQFLQQTKTINCIGSKNSARSDILSRRNKRVF